MLPDCSLYTLVFLVSERKKEITHDEAAAEKILFAFAEIFKLSINDLKGKSRRKDIVAVRHLYCYITGQLIPWVSLSKIAKTIGKRDHTTIMHSRKVVRNLLYAGDEMMLSFLTKYMESAPFKYRPILHHK